LGERYCGKRLGARWPRRIRNNRGKPAMSECSPDWTCEVRWGWIDSAPPAVVEEYNRVKEIGALRSLFWRRTELDGTGGICGGSPIHSNPCSREDAEAELLMVLANGIACLATPDAKAFDFMFVNPTAEPDPFHGKAAAGAVQHCDSTPQAIAMFLGAVRASYREVELGSKCEWVVLSCIRFAASGPQN
jgi:hypothetical protein